MNKINKPDLIVAVTVRTGLHKKDVEAVVDSFIQEVSDLMKSGEKVHIHGFGDFSTTSRSARKGRNPQTGAEIDIAASYTPKFKASKALKEAVK